MTQPLLGSMRTHACGALRVGDAGSTVRLAGWVARRRDHGGVIFLDLRDASGVVQVVCRSAGVAAAAHEVRAEYCLQVVGTVSARPAGSSNPDLATGDVEVTATALEVLSESAPPPFPIERDVDVSEEARLRWRYLDLRRPEVARALRVRTDMLRAARAAMDDLGFGEVETPYLTRSTPEGARDFLVPARLQPGHWYALPQSPQLFKQLMMVAGWERYYQIVRCFRDEDFRADRQPEFTQLDIEMSFCDTDDVFAVGEAVITRIWRDVLGVELPTPFRRLTYAEAMTRYGSDKPDLRFGLELVDLSGFFANTKLGIFRGVLDAGGHIGAVRMPGGAELTRKQMDAWVDWARGRGAKGLAYVAIQPDGTIGRSTVAKQFSVEETAGFAAAAGADPGDLVFVAAAPRTEALELLGALRAAVAADRGLIPEGRWELLWVTDMPMFEPGEEGGWTALHHPFTAPAAGWEDKFEAAPGDALARAYDTVCNGWELSSGSIRIHRADLQQRVFDVLKITPEEAAEKFGFLLEAFRYGPPPHGGVAFGLDRIAALLAGHDSIREVIAFPKAASGTDPLTGAPTPITHAQRREAGVDAT
jgi:aspartyl-tRNA synthetase